MSGLFGKGTTLEGVTTGYVGYITNISTNETLETIDTTSMESDYREFIASWHDAGEITLTCNYDGSALGVGDALHKAYLGTAYAADVDCETWTVTLPDGSTLSCDGMITNLSTAVPFDDKITQDVTIKLTGEPTFTDVASVG